MSRFTPRLTNLLMSDVVPCVRPSSPTALFAELHGGHACIISTCRSPQPKALALWLVASNAMHTHLLTVVGCAPQPIQLQLPRAAACNARGLLRMPAIPRTASFAAAAAASKLVHIRGYFSESIDAAVEGVLVDCMTVSSG